MRAIRFTLLSLAVLFGILYLIYVFYIYCNQEEMVFRNHKLAPGYEFAFNADFEEITVPTSDSVQLHGILFKAKESKGLVFYLHGNAGALDSWGEIAPVYTNLGYDIFILDYRGFGKSEGETEDEFQVFNDVSAAYAIMNRRYKEKDIVIAGYSIGTGPAAHLASVKNPKSLILQSPYDNFLRYTSGRVPFFPDFLKKFSFETDVFVKKIKCPVIIFHGKEDLLIPYDNSVRLQDFFKPVDRLFLLDGQGHLGMNDNEVYQKELKNIIR